MQLRHGDRVVCQPDGVIPRLVITFRGSDLNPAPSDPLASFPHSRRWLSQYAARKAVRMICVWSQGTEAAAFVVSVIAWCFLPASIPRYSCPGPYPKPGPSWDGVYPSGSYCSMQGCHRR